MIDMLFYKRNRYLASPTILQLEITTICPLQCPQCYKELKPKHADFYELKERLNDAKASGVHDIMINGGEPALHPNFVELLHYIVNDLEMDAYCYLSGFSLNEDKIKLMKHDKIYISISLNGSTEQVNQLSRDGYQYSIDAIHKMKEHNMRFGINWVARSDNVEDFPHLVQLALENNASWINIINNKISGGIIHSKLSSNECITLANYINEYRKDIRIPIESCNTILSRFTKDKFGEMYNGCIAGKLALFIDIDGNYMPCSHLHYPEKASNILDYWNNSIHLKNLRESRTEELCNNCVNSKKCYFCKANSQETHDNFYASYETCPFQRVERNV